MKYYHLEPEVAGGIGERTVLDRSGPRLKATSLHYEFDGWLGDDLLAGHPSFIATRRLAEEITLNRLTGVTPSHMETSRSITFETIYPGRQLPEFVWLKIDGNPASPKSSTPGQWQAHRLCKGARGVESAQPEPLRRRSLSRSRPLTIAVTQVDVSTTEYGSQFRRPVGGQER